MAPNKLRNKILLEFAWWIFTGLLLLILLLPLHINDIAFPFLDYNAFFIVAAVTFIRLIFLLRHSFLAHNLPLKFLFMFLSVVVFMLAYRGLSLFNIFNDQNGYYFLYEHLPLDTRYSLAAYVYKQYFFTGIAAATASVLMPFRLLVSIFRVRNRGTE